MKVNKIALLITFLVTVFTTLLLFVFHYFKINISFLYFLPFIVYFTSHYWIQKELYSKVRTIYKNIYNFKISKKELKNKVKYSQIGLNEVNKQVDEWIVSNTNKIDDILANEIYRKEYIGNVAHELKNPIFNIQGYMSILLEGAMYEEELCKKYLLKAEDNIDRMMAIVKDLDTITQLETGEIKLNIKSFDILNLVKEVVDSFEIIAKEANIILQIQSDEPCFVKADKDRIRQVLVNLIENAIRYSKIDSKYVNVKLFDMDDLCLVEVSDKGVGISQQDLPRLFERFYRVDKARSRQHKGSGLGLSIVKHIIEAHNQTINVRSRLGEGSVFGFTLEKNSLKK